LKLLISTSSKELNEIQLFVFLECQSIYFGDDLEYYDDLSEDAASFGDAPCGFWD
jgi:hypothetical protein